MKKARAQGIEPVLYVNGFPGVVERRPRSLVGPPSNPGRLRRLHGRGGRALSPGTPMDRLRRAEPLRELPAPGRDGGRRAPRLYAQLCSMRRTARCTRPPRRGRDRRQRPPGRLERRTTTAPDTFLRNMVLPNGRRPRMDMFGINPYTERNLDMELPHVPGRVDFNDLDWLVASARPLLGPGGYSSSSRSSAGTPSTQRAAGCTSSPARSRPPA